MGGGVRMGERRGTMVLLRLAALKGSTGRRINITLRISTKYRARGPRGEGGRGGGAGGQGMAAAAVQAGCPGPEEGAAAISSSGGKGRATNPSELGRKGDDLVVVGDGGWYMFSLFRGVVIVLVMLSTHKVACFSFLDQEPTNQYLLAVLRSISILCMRRCLCTGALTPSLAQLPGGVAICCTHA